MGTAHFMSPEQCDGEDVDGRTDIYSLGVMYYYLLTGDAPFNSTSRLAVLEMHKAEPVPDARDLVPSLPEAVSRIIQKAMAKKREERFQTCEEMIADMEGLEQGARRRWPWAAAAGVLLVATILLVHLAFRDTGGPARLTSKTSPTKLPKTAEVASAHVRPRSTPATEPTPATTEPPASQPTPAIVAATQATPVVVEDITWELGPSLVGPRSGPAVGALGASVLCAGGSLDFRRGCVNVLAFDTDANEWTDLPNMPEPRVYAQGVVVGSRFYGLGGVHGNQTRSEVFCLSKGDGQWGWAPSVPLEPDRAWHAAAVWASKIVVAGGHRRRPDGPRYDPQGMLSRVEMLDLTRPDEGWQRLPDIPGRPRGWCAGAVVGNRLYLFGGVHFRSERVGDRERLSETLCLDLSTKAWTRKRDLPFPLSGLDAAAVDDRRVVLVGGYNPDAPTEAGKFSDAVLIYDTKNDAFQIMPSRMPVGANDARAVLHGNALYVVGGERTSSTVRAVRVGRIQWSETPALSVDSLVAKLPTSFEKGFMLPDSDKDQYGNPVHVRNGKKVDPETGYPYELWFKEPRMELVWIPAGEFMMGSDKRTPKEKPTHRVQISKRFYLAKYEITQGQWAAVMGSSPWSGRDRFTVKSDSRNPAVCISWEDCQELVKKLGGAAGWGFRLPSEAEWEYACRAGSTSAYCFGDDPSRLKEYAWYRDNARDVGEDYGHGVGLKKPNSWGLYDMHGNVWERCQDRSGDYPSGIQTDPRGPSRGWLRVNRGGSTYNAAGHCRTGFRYTISPDLRSDQLGARPALSLPSEALRKASDVPTPGQQTKKVPSRPSAADVPRYELWKRLGPSVPVPGDDGTIQQLPAGVVSDLAYTPDGTLLLVAHSFGVDLWDTSTRNIMRRLDGHEGAVNDIDLSADGKRLATASQDATIGLWDMASGKLEQRLVGHRSAVARVVFHPDGRLLASGGGAGDGTVRLWDLQTGSDLGVLATWNREITSTAFSPDGKWLAFGRFAGDISVWDVARRECVATLTPGRKSGSTLDFSPDSKLLAAGTRDLVEMWRTSDWKLVQTKSVKWSKAVRFSPDGRALASAGLGEGVMWETATWRPMLEFDAPLPVSIAFAPQDRTFASGCTTEGSSVVMHDLSTGRNLHTLPTYGHKLVSVALNPDAGATELLVAESGRPCCASLWQIESGQKRQFCPVGCHATDRCRVRFSRDGRLVVCGDIPGEPKLWDAHTGRLARRLKGHTSVVMCVCFSPDGAKVLTGSRDKTVRLWDVATGREIRSFAGQTVAVTDVAFSADGTRVVASSYYGDDRARVWDATSGALLGSVRGSGSITCVATAATGHDFATGEIFGRVTLWNGNTFTLRHRIKAKTTGNISSLAYSPSGALLVNGATSGSLQVWHAGTLRKLQTLKGHRDRVTDISFSTDGSLLTTCGWDGQILLWRQVQAD